LFRTKGKKDAKETKGNRRVWRGKKGKPHVLKSTLSTRFGKRPREGGKEEQKEKSCKRKMCPRGVTKRGCARENQGLVGGKYLVRHRR